MTDKAKWWREYDLTYWQMRSALGYSIPSRIEERWPTEMNAGNSFKCGMCDARRQFPATNVSGDLRHYARHLSGSELEEFKRRVMLVINEVWPQ